MGKVFQKKSGTMKNYKNQRAGKRVVFIARMWNKSVHISFIRGSLISENVDDNMLMRINSFKSCTKYNLNFVVVILRFNRRATEYMLSSHSSSTVVLLSHDYI